MSTAEVPDVGLISQCQTLALKREGVSIITQLLSEVGSLPAKSLYQYLENVNKPVCDASGNNFEEFLRFLNELDTFLIDGTDQCIVRERVPSLSSEVIQTEILHEVSQSEIVLLKSEGLDTVKNLIEELGPLPARSLYHYLKNINKPVFEATGQNYESFLKYLNASDNISIEDTDLQIVHIHKEIVGFEFESSQLKATDYQFVPTSNNYETVPHFGNLCDKCKEFSTSTFNRQLAEEHGVNILKSILKLHGSLPIKYLIGHLSYMNPAVRKAVGKNSTELLQFVKKCKYFIVKESDHTVHINNKMFEQNESSSLDCTTVEEDNKTERENKNIDNQSTTPTESIIIAPVAASGTTGLVVQQSLDDFNTSELSTSLILNYPLPTVKDIESNNFNDLSICAEEGCVCVDVCTCRGTNPRESPVAEAVITGPDITIKSSIVDQIVSRPNIVSNNIYPLDGNSLPSVINECSIEKLLRVNNESCKDNILVISQVSDNSSKENIPSLSNSKNLKQKIVNKKCTTNNTQNSNATETVKAQIGTITRIMYYGDSFAEFDNHESVYISVGVFNSSLKNFPETDIDMYRVGVCVYIDACLSDAMKSCKWRATAVSLVSNKNASSSVKVNKSCSINSVKNTNKSSDKCLAPVLLPVCQNVSSVNEQELCHKEKDIFQVSNSTAVSIESQELISVHASVNVPLHCRVAIASKQIDNSVVNENNTDSSEMAIINDGVIISNNTFDSNISLKKDVRERRESISSSAKRVGCEEHEFESFTNQSDNKMDHLTKKLQDQIIVEIISEENIIKKSKADVVLSKSVNMIANHGAGAMKLTDALNFEVNSDNTKRGPDIVCSESKLSTSQDARPIKLFSQSAAMQRSLKVIKKALAKLGPMPVKNLCRYLFFEDKAVRDLVGNNETKLLKFLSGNDNFLVEGPEHIVRENHKQLQLFIPKKYKLKDAVSDVKIVVRTAEQNTEIFINSELNSCETNVSKDKLVESRNNHVDQNSGHNFPDIPTCSSFIKRYCQTGDNIKMVEKASYVSHVNNSCSFPDEENSSTFVSDDCYAGEKTPRISDQVDSFLKILDAGNHCCECTGKNINILHAENKFAYSASREDQQLFGKNDEESSFSKECLKKFSRDHSKDLTYDKGKKLTFLIKPTSLIDNQNVMHQDTANIFEPNTVHETAKSKSNHTVLQIKSGEVVIDDHFLACRAPVMNSSIEMSGIQFLMSLINEYGPLLINVVNDNWPSASPIDWNCFVDAPNTKYLKSKQLKEFCEKHCDILNHINKTVSNIHSFSRYIKVFHTESDQDVGSATNAEEVSLVATSPCLDNETLTPNSKMHHEDPKLYADDNLSAEDAILIEEKSLSFVKSIVKRFGPIFVSTLKQLLLGTKWSQQAAPSDVLTCLSRTSDNDSLTNTKVIDFIMKHNDQFDIQDTKVYIVNSPQYAYWTAQNTREESLSPSLEDSSYISPIFSSNTGVCLQIDGEVKTNAMPQNLNVQIDCAVSMDDQYKPSESMSLSFENNPLETSALKFLTSLIDSVGSVSFSALNDSRNIASAEIRQLFGETPKNQTLKERQLRRFCERHSDVFKYEGHTVSLVNASRIKNKCVTDAFAMSKFDLHSDLDGQNENVMCVHGLNKLHQRTISEMTKNESLKIVSQAKSEQDVLIDNSFLDTGHVENSLLPKMSTLKRKKLEDCCEKQCDILNAKKAGELVDSNSPFVNAVRNNSIHDTQSITNTESNTENFMSDVEILTSTINKQHGDQKRHPKDNHIKKDINVVEQKSMNKSFPTKKVDRVIASNENYQKSEGTLCSIENAHLEISLLKFLVPLIRTIGPLSFSALEDVLDVASSDICQYLRDTPKTCSLNEGKLKQFCEKYCDVLKYENLTISVVDFSAYQNIIRMNARDLTTLCSNSAHKARSVTNTAALSRKDSSNACGVSTAKPKVHHEDQTTLIKDNFCTANSSIEHRSVHFISCIVKNSGPVYVSTLRKILLSKRRAKRSAPMDVLIYLSQTADINFLSNKNVTDFVLQHGDQFDIQQRKIYLVKSPQYVALFAEEPFQDSRSRVEASSISSRSLENIRNKETDLVDKSSLNFLVSLLRSQGRLSFLSLNSYQKFAPAEVRQYFGVTLESPVFKKVKLIEFCDRHREVLNYTQSEIYLVHSISGNKSSIIEDPLSASVDEQKFACESSKNPKNKIAHLLVDSNSNNPTTPVGSCKRTSSPLEDTSTVETDIELKSLMCIKQIITKYGPSYLKSLKSLLLGQIYSQHASPLDVLIHLSGGSKFLSPATLQEFISKHRDHIAKYNSKVYLVNSSQKASQIIQKQHHESIMQELLKSKDTTVSASGSVQKEAFPAEVEMKSSHGMPNYKKQKESSVTVLKNFTGAWNQNNNLMNATVESLALEFLVCLIRSNRALTFSTLSNSRHLASLEIQQLFGVTSKRPFFVRKNLREFCQRHSDVFCIINQLEILLVNINASMHECVLPLKLSENVPESAGERDKIIRLSRSKKED